jgi:Xaa-Pro aminopeptidase
MDRDTPDWQLAVFFGRINLLYFTGTVQDGMLLIPREGEEVFWVRRSCERARDESHFPHIRPMPGGFRDASARSGSVPATAYMETEVVPLAHLQRFQKYFPVREVKSLDSQIGKVRAVKSGYEISCMEQAGNIHRRVLEDHVPGILAEGMSEAEFGGELFSVMVQEGHHGIVRFGVFGTEIVLGQIGFGESSLYPTSFDGPGGCYGMGPAVPLLGSRERTLRKGDLVFVDTGCGVNGYHTDKTMTYMFGRSLPDEVILQHQRCVEIQNQIARLLKPGIPPSEIYTTIMESLDPEFLRNFMGYGERRANFLGHGIGLVIDEMPVISRGFDDPLVENMVFALEPKKGIPGIGMVGTENTFVVTPHGGRSLTGDHPGLIPVY